MGVSFKISRTGSRVKPKPALISETIAETSGESSKILSKNESNNSTANTNTTISGRKLNVRDEDAAGLSASTQSSGRLLFSSDDEVSFTLNLFPDGYSIGKPSEDNAHYASLQEDAAKLLHPYDRTSETLFSAIESGWLPGDILDDIPCKYVDGGLICEVRDFRKCISDSGSIVLSAGVSPTTAKVHLKMSLENVVKDIPSIVDDSWTYGDLMEVESRIVKALQPKLCLDPTPRLDRLCSNPASSKLNLGLSSLRRKRLREMPEVTISYGGRLHGKKISVGRLPENSSYRVGGSGPSDVLPQHVQETISAQNIGPNIMSSRSGSFVQDASVSAMSVMPQQSKFLHGVGNQRSTQDPLAGTMLNTSVASVSQDMTITYNDNVNSNVLPHAKMETQEGQMSPYSAKRVRLGSVVPDSPHSQQIGSYMDSLQGADAQWKNPLLQQQANTRGIQYAGTGMPKYSQLGREAALNQDGATAVSLGQQGMRYGVNVDHNEADKLDKSEPIRIKNDGQIAEADINQPRLAPQAFIRNNFHQAGWNSLGQQVEKDSRREEQLQKRKTVQSPRVSSGIVSHSPFSAKSAELAGGSLGGQYGAISPAAPLGSSQRDKSVGMSLPSAIRSHSGLSGANDSMQQQAQAASKWRSNSLPKAPAMSGVGSPASISNVSMPMNAASPSVSSGTMGDQSMLEKFSKIEMVAARYKLNCKRTKADDYFRKPRTFSTQEVMVGLSNTSNNDNLKDDNHPMPLSKSLAGGDINTLKIRVLTFSMPDTALSGNAPGGSRTRTRLIMSVKPQDATVAMHFGDLEDRDYLNAEDYLPSLATPHFADLLASQFSTLMHRDGYYFDDHVQPRPARTNAPSTSQSSIPSSVSEIQQYAEGASGPQTHETKPIVTPSASQSPSLLASTGISSSGGNPMQMSQGLVHGAPAPVRPTQQDAQQAVAQQHAQLPNQQQMMHQNQPQFSRSVLLPPTSHPQLNPMGHNSNTPLGGQMANKPSLQMLQQPNPQQQQSHLQQTQMQRKMMVGLGTAMGMGNINNNMVGLGGLGGVMGMTGPRGIGGVPGVSSPMGSLSGIGNMAPNSMGISQATNLSNTISQQLRAGSLTPQAQAFLASRMRMAQSRGMLGGPQAGVTGISGARQMQPGSPGLSMLSQGLNRGANINPMQRTAMGAMAAPKLMTGMNVHMNQQQLQHQLQQQQQMQQQPQPLQQPQPQLQQQDASPLQSVLSPQQVGSQSMGLSPTIDQTGMVQQQASPQMSSGAMHPASSGNPEPGPASPQLSSQTMGSVGSLRNSPMDMQGVNKKSNA